ncbi:MAG TPA: ABC transporter ATP-binding protein [Candidatus Obscuribacterales bacterium]
MIKAEALSRKYGDVVAVSDVSFEIGAGEIVGLLGHNGAGKTTIMKMLTGYLEPSAGAVTIEGVDVWSNRSFTQRRVGYLPENCPLYPDMAVLDYLDYLAVLRGVPESQRAERLLYVIEKAALTSVAKSEIGTLSRGYRQRLGVAQALLNSPRIVILDEPTNGLDPSQILEMRELIRELARTATIVLSTHILQEVQAVCSRVIIINNGKVALDQALSDLQSMRRVRIVTDAQPASVNELLAALGDLSVDECRHRDKLYEYIVEAPADESAPSVNRLLVENGWRVYAIHPVVRDLETIFGEITAGARAQDVSVKSDRAAAGQEDLMVPQGIAQKVGSSVGEGGAANE